MENIEIVGIASGWGAQVRESEFGPEVLRDSNFHKSIFAKFEKIVHPQISCKGHNLGPGLQIKGLLLELFQKSSSAITSILQDGNFPVVIGGDHSNAIATWSAIINHYQVQQNFGLIWIDAHMDGHDLKTSPSKAFHGMPVATLLGKGEEEFTNLVVHGAKLNPKHIILIGIRSYEDQEREYLENLGVRIMYMQEVKSRGFEMCFEEALNIVSKCKKFGVSLDLDFFDPSYAPGTPSLEPHGEDPKNVLPHLEKLKDYSNFAAFELVEFNPDTDKDDITLRLVENIITKVVI